MKRKKHTFAKEFCIIFVKILIIKYLIYYHHLTLVIKMKNIKK